MTHFATAAIAAGILSTAALGWAAGSASAAPSRPPDASATVHALEASGYKVILNKVGDGELSMCSVAGVRPGRMITQRTTDSGGDTVDKVVYTTIYLDVVC